MLVKQDDSKVHLLMVASIDYRLCSCI